MTYKELFQTQLHKTLELTKINLFSEPAATRVVKEVPAIFWPEKKKNEAVVLMWIFILRLVMEKCHLTYSV